MKKLLLLLVFFVTISCSTLKKEVKTYEVGQIITSKGEMLFWLSDKTPLHKTSFIKLAKANYWDSLTFNRVIKNFVIQGGCPDTPEGFVDSPYFLNPEFNNDLKHIYGAVGAGRDDNPEKLSASCQFYIVNNKNGIPRLDGDYTIFGQVFNGFDVLDAISSVETDSLDTPLTNLTLDVTIISLTEKELKKYGYDLKSPINLNEK